MNDAILSAGTASVSRRTLLRGALAGATVSALGAGHWARAMSKDHDLIIIGGGTAGLPAAIAAAEGGARVLIIEQAAQLGGTLHLSTGQMAAAGTVFQAQAGIEDTPEAHYADAMRINGNTSVPELLALWTGNAAPTIDWLAQHGFEIVSGQPVYAGAHEPYLARRYFWGPEGGISIFHVLMAMAAPHIQAGRIDVMLETTAAELIQAPSGAVTGVLVEDAAGRRHDVPGRAVLLAAGGCASNPRMYKDLHGVPLYCQAAYPYSQGAGLMLGLGAGGRLRGGDKYLGLFGSVMADGWTPASLDFSLQVAPELRMPWELYVNAHGERFMREDLASVHAREIVLGEQPGHRYWTIFDEGTLAQAPPIIAGRSREALRDTLASHPLCHSAPTLASLAVRAGLDPLALQRNVADYNALREARRADRFGREHRPASISEGPYYAIQSQGWTLVSFAGLTVDAELGVLDGHDQPIPGLYAAGEILGAGATSGRGYVGGSLVTPALTYGRLLGQRLARSV